jgi:hypothetical protein
MGQCKSALRTLYISCRKAKLKKSLQCKSKDWDFKAYAYADFRCGFKKAKETVQVWEQSL